uniref:Lysosomal dipeptide transporter MFSD1 n=1 Tax=Ditylum brightwellii TaxID=49249 RepID=A0A7S4QG63_9STRA|mmetsp:Transcript_43155/g.65152  ORF Transcript_43155/g.65152 Transcript_43155/m.65152 type:complete len:480 (+) Transcript_43155:156-1595(+)
MTIKGPICAILCSIICLANHFSRDAPGTIEEQLALDPNLSITPARYATLTAVYFTPSAFVPLLLGLLSTTTTSGGSSAPLFKPEDVFLACAWTAVLGNVMSAVAVAAFGSYHGLVAGRAVAGMAYEAVDMLPLGFLPALLPGSWASWSGFLNGILRLGSAFAFVFLPRVYDNKAGEGGGGGGGTGAVFIVVAIVGFTIGPLATLVCVMFKQSRKKQKDSDYYSKQQQQQQHEIIHAVQERKSPLKSMIQQSIKSMPRLFWLYSFVGMTMYASVVPFWFYGSAYLQRSRGLSLKSADALMVLPEGAIIILSTPVGILVDCFKLGFAAQQRALGVASICIALSYVLLLSGVLQSAMWGVISLGCSYAVANQLLWSAFPHACPEELGSLGAGIMACLINVGATLVPALIGAIRALVELPETADIFMLLLLASLALVAAVVSHVSVSRIICAERIISGYEEVNEVAAFTNNEEEAEILTRNIL